MIRSETDVVVVGAGIVGVAAAYYLARAGKRVVVVDKGVIGGEASGRNGGHLSPTIDGAWAPLGQLALDTWPRLIPEIDGPTEYRRGGGLYVVVAQDPMDPVDILTYRAARGFVAELLSAEECRRHLPPVRNEIKGGVLSPRHGQVNPILTTKSLAHTAAVHFGVEFLLHSAVTAISVADGAVNGVRVASATIAAPTVVLAAGAWTGQLASTAGVACPIGPRRIQILLSEAMAQWTDLVWAGNGVYARQSLSGHLHFGSGGPAWESAVPEVSYTVAPGWHAAHSPTHVRLHAWLARSVDTAQLGRRDRSQRGRGAGAGGLRPAARAHHCQWFRRQWLRDGASGGAGCRTACVAWSCECRRFRSIPGPLSRLTTACQTRRCGQSAGSARTRLTGRTSRAHARQVVAKTNDGAAGSDGESIAEFKRDLKGNLYKLWNRLSSGSYFPAPVRAVEIPKKHGQGGSRILGVPTVADRIAQTVVRLYLEPKVEPVFHPDSYGYRPRRSALQAVGICRERCWRSDWVIEFDITSFFDSVPHALIMCTAEAFARSC